MASQTASQSGPAGTSDKSTSASLAPYCLHITVVRAENLPIADITSSDPYVLVDLDGKNIGKTQTIYRNRESPQWNKSLQPINLYHLSHTVHFVIFDEDEDGSDDKLGSASLDLISLGDSFYQTINKEFTLNDCKTNGKLFISVVLQRFNEIISLLPDETDSDYAVEHQNIERFLDLDLPRPAIDVLAEYAKESIKPEDAQDCFYDILNLTNHSVNQPSNDSKNFLIENNKNVHKVIASFDSYRVIDDLSEQMISKRPVRYDVATGIGDRAYHVWSDKCILLHMNNGLTHYILFQDIGTIYKWTRCLQFAFDLMYNRVFDDCPLPTYVQDMDDFIYSNNLELNVQQLSTSTSFSSPPVASTSLKEGSIYSTYTGLTLRMRSRAITIADSSVKVSISLENVTHFTVPFQFMPVGNSSIHFEVQHFDEYNGNQNHFIDKITSHSLDPHLMNNCSKELRQEKDSESCLPLMTTWFSCGCIPSSSTEVMDGIQDAIQNVNEGLGKTQSTYFAIWGQNQKHKSYSKSGLLAVWKESAYFDFDNSIDPNTMTFGEDKSNLGFYLMVYQRAGLNLVDKLMGVSYVPMSDFLNKSKNVLRNCPYNYNSTCNVGEMKIPISLEKKIEFSLSIQKVDLFINKNAPGKPRIMDESVAIECCYADYNGSKCGKFDAVKNLSINESTANKSKVPENEEFAINSYIIKSSTKDNNMLSDNKSDFLVNAVDGLDNADFIKLNFYFDHFTKSNSKADSLNVLQDFGKTIANGLGFNNSLGAAFIPIDTFGDSELEITVPIIIYQKYSESVKKIYDKDIALVDNFSIGEITVKVCRKMTSITPTSTHNAVPSGTTDSSSIELTETINDSSSGNDSTSSSEHSLVVKYEISNTNLSSYMWPCGVLPANSFTASLTPGKVFAESFLIAPAFEGLLLKSNKNGYLNYGNYISHKPEVDDPISTRNRSKLPESYSLESPKVDITVEVYENEQLALFWSKKHLSPLEIAPFTDIDAKKVVYNKAALESIYDAYPPLEYDWLNDWKVEVVGSSNENSKCATDEFGWIYSLNFTSLYQILKNGPPKGVDPSKPIPTDHVRTRKWVRKARMSSSSITIKDNIHSIFSSDSTAFDWRIDTLKRNQSNQDLILSLCEENKSPSSPFIIPYSKVSDIDVVSDTLLCVRLKDMSRAFLDSNSRLEWRGGVQIDLFIPHCPASYLKNLIEDRIYLYSLREGIKQSINDCENTIAMKNATFFNTTPKTPLSPTFSTDSDHKEISSPSANLRRERSTRLNLGLKSTDENSVPDASSKQTSSYFGSPDKQRSMLSQPSFMLKSNVSKRLLLSQSSFASESDPDDNEPAPIELSPGVHNFNDLDKEFVLIDKELLGANVNPFTLTNSAQFSWNSREYYLLKKRFQVKLYIAFMLSLKYKVDHKFKENKAIALMKHDVKISKKFNQGDEIENTIRQLHYLTSVGEKRILECGLYGWESRSTGVPSTLTLILNHYVFEIASLLGSYFDGSKMSKIKGWENKIQLLVEFMKENDRLQNALSTSIRFYKYIVNKPVVLSIFLNPKDLIIWYSNCLSEEMNSVIDKVLNVWKNNDPSGNGVKFKYPLPWYPMRIEKNDKPFFISRLTQDTMLYLSNYIQYARVNDLGSPSFEGIIKTFDSRLALSYINAIQYLGVCVMREISQIDWSDPKVSYVKGNINGVVPAPSLVVPSEILEERSDFVSMICNDSLEFVKSNSITHPSEKNEFVTSFFCDGIDEIHDEFPANSPVDHSRIRKSISCETTSKLDREKSRIDDLERRSLRLRLKERVSNTYTDFLSCHIYSVDLLALMTLSRARQNITETFGNIFEGDKSLFSIWAGDYQSDSKACSHSESNNDNCAEWQPQWDIALFANTPNEALDNYLSKKTENCIRLYFESCFELMAYHIDSLQSVESYLLYFDLCLSRFFSLMLTFVLYSFNAEIFWPNFKSSAKNSNLLDFSIRFYYDIKYLIGKSRELYATLRSKYLPLGTSASNESEIAGRMNIDQILTSWNETYLEENLKIMEAVAHLFKLPSLDRRFIRITNVFTEAARLNPDDSLHLMNLVLICVLVRQDSRNCLTDTQIADSKRDISITSGPIIIKHKEKSDKLVHESKQRKSILYKLGIKKIDSKELNLSDQVLGDIASTEGSENENDKNEDILDGDILLETILSIDATPSKSLIDHLKHTSRENLDKEMTKFGFQASSGKYYNMVDYILHYSDDKNVNESSTFKVNVKTLTLTWDKNKLFYKRTFELFREGTTFNKGVLNLLTQSYLLTSRKTQVSPTSNSETSNKHENAVLKTIITESDLTAAKPISKDVTLEINEIEITDLWTERKISSYFVGKSNNFIEISVTNKSTGKEMKLESNPVPASSHISWTRNGTENYFHFSVPLQSYLDGFLITCRLMDRGSLFGSAHIGHCIFTLAPLENEGVKEVKLTYDEIYIKKNKAASTSNTCMKMRFKVINTAESLF